MWKDIFSNTQREEEEEQEMLEDFKKPRASRINEDVPVLGGSETVNVNSFLDKGTEFEGKLAFEGAVRINGRFSGEIFSEGTLYVGDGGSVNAEIQVSTAIISGEVTGDVGASTKVELQRSARLRGNIRTKTLKIEEGAIFEGNCQMKQEEEPARKPARKEPLEVPVESPPKGLELS